MDIENLWNKYKKDGSHFEEIVLHYEYLVKTTAATIARGLPNHIEFDDLVSDGFIGLMDAIKKYDSSYGYKFETYASFRIRGEILDRLRQFDWAPRSLRSKNREIELAAQKLSNEMGREPTDEEIAKLLGWEVGDISRYKGAGSSASIFNIDEVIKSDGDSFKLSDLIEDQTNLVTFLEDSDISFLRDKIFEAFSELSSQQKTVFFLHYIEGLSLKEISEMLEVTESRVCQIHTGALDAVWRSCVPS